MKSSEKALIWAVLPMLLLTPLLMWFGSRFERQLSEAERLRAQHTLELHSSDVQRAFDRIEGKLDSLAFFVSSQPLDEGRVELEQFDTFAAGLHASSHWIRAFQIVSNGIITHAYPAKGNEAVLGYNLMTAPPSYLGADVLRAQQRGQITITGPLDLIQGGLGIIVRKPALRTNDPTARLVGIVLNLVPLLAESGIGTENVNDVRLAIRRSPGEVFFGSPAVFQGSPVTRVISLPDGAWEMGGCPINGWQAAVSPPVRMVYAGGGTVILLLCALFFALARSQANLTQTVREQTTALRAELAARHEAQEQFRLIMENLADMVAVLDLDGHRLYNSPSYSSILGNPRNLVGTSSFDQIHPEDRNLVKQAFENTVRTGIGHRLSYRLVDQSGQARYIESQGSVIRDDSGRVSKVIVVSRDVTDRQRTEEILQENEMRYRFLFEHNPIPMLIYDRLTLQLLAVNEAFIDHYGYSSKAALALRLTDLYPEDQKAKIVAMIPQLRGHANAGEWRHRKSDGSFMTIVVSSHDLVYAGRDARVAVMTDITARKMAEEALRDSEQKYRDLVQHANSIILRWNSSGQIMFLNEFGLNFFGYSAEEIFGRHVVGSIVPVTESGGRDLCQQIAQLLSNPSAFEQNINENMRRNGERVWVSWTNRIVQDDQGTVIEILSVGSDITARKLAEMEIHRLHEDLQRYAAELEQRVNERTAELVQARDRAQIADQTKSAFLATMSHELRTPLNSIIGFTGILRQGLAGPLNAEQNKQLDMVRNSARHLLALINDVLDISKIEAGQLEIAPAPFDLREALDKVLQSVAPLAEKKHLKLVKEISSELGPILNDRRRVEQVLLNLLSNAIKFSERGAVTLKAEALPGEVRISVADTGIGIKPEDLGKLFQPFRQLDTGLARQHDGTGLGLAICKRLAERMGGTVSVTSVWGKGSTFDFTVPAALKRNHE